MEKIEFMASIPQLQSAIRLSGDAGARIMFDIPETELPVFLKLVAFGRNKVLKITIEGEQKNG